jgi:hypothetical protein
MHIYAMYYLPFLLLHVPFHRSIYRSIVTFLFFLRQVCHTYGHTYVYGIYICHICFKMYALGQILIYPYTGVFAPYSLSRQPRTRTQLHLLYL